MFASFQSAMHRQCHALFYSVRGGEISRAGSTEHEGEFNPRLHAVVAAAAYVLIFSRRAMQSNIIVNSNHMYVRVFIFVLDGDDISGDV